MDESDGVEETFEGQMRLVLAAAAQAGERLARLRADLQRRRQGVDEQEARRINTRLDAERRTSAAEVSRVHQDTFWQQATPAQIATAYQATRAWSQESPEHARAEQRIRDEMRTRYGVDVDEVRTNPALIKAAMDQSAGDREGAATERSRAAAEEANAQRLMHGADAEDRRRDHTPNVDEPDATPEDRAPAPRQEAAREYDSAERRRDVAEDLESRGVDKEVVATRMRADVSQGRPATEAVSSGRGARKAPRARKNRGRGAQVQRPGLNR